MQGLGFFKQSHGKWGERERERIKWKVTWKLEVCRDGDLRGIYKGV